MVLTKSVKLIIILSSITVASAAIITPTTIFLMNNNNPITEAKYIKITLIDNAGVMIETDDVRIYIDPINLVPTVYSELPADFILITHDHGDHFDPYCINFIRTNDTTCIFPEMMSTEVAYYDAIGAVPGDTFQFDHVNITCFYMYTFAPEGYEPSHPPESNYTSFIIEVAGMTFFHAGDSGNIPEYSQLHNLIDVAFLPLGPGCQTMADQDVVNAIDVIRPDYFIPIHYMVGTDAIFCDTYGTQIENCDCEIIHLLYGEYCQFEVV